jgi:hypothetical protein
MCCFSGDVKAVAGTQIFARRAEPGRQYLVYAMQYDAPGDLAMILPLPVPSRPAEDAVQFIDLSDYPEFFDDLANGFPLPRGGDSRSEATALEVHVVGEFEASFVPQMSDFGRLDPRYRIPPATWAGLPEYSDYGFAVFKLRAGAIEVHPMAFSFPTRMANQLFFPTVHIHDGTVQPRAFFDHTLFCQTRGTARRWPATDDGTEWPASRFMKAEKAGGLIDGGEIVYRTTIHGHRRNQDLWLKE